jgi:hypothetical protein
VPSGKRINNVELERMWKGAIVAYTKELSWPSPGATEESHENPHSV